MAYHRIIVVGGSAGAIEAMRVIAHALPRDFPAPICIVQHISAESPGLLPQILRWAGKLPADHARDGDLVAAGHIYVAPPDRHFLLGPGGRMILGAGPKENRFRPAIDPLFRSAAQHFGPQVIGVVLSGGLDDGSAGLCDIKEAGGLALVQQPEEAQAPSMPKAALRAVAVDHCLSAAALGLLLDRLAREPLPDASLRLQPQKDVAMENCIAAGEDPKGMDLDELSDLSRLTCPDCAGVLRRVKRPPLRYRCHSGHAYTAETLGDAVRKRAGDSVWAAIQRHGEQEDFLRDAARLQTERGDPEVASRLTAEADKAAGVSQQLRALLVDVTG